VQTLLDLGPVKPAPVDELLEGARQGVTRSGSCSTKYVRGREARRPGVVSKGVIANCNHSFILQEVVQVATDTTKVPKGWKENDASITSPAVRPE